MNKLEEARLVINSVDDKMIELFKERMKAAEMVASYKKENGLVVFDKKREDEIILKNKNKLNDSTLEEYYLEWFKSMLKVSKDYQKKIIGDSND